MPICSFCGHMEATVNLRRRRPPHTGTYRCKDKDLCGYRMVQTKLKLKEEEKRGES